MQLLAEFLVQTLVKGITQISISLLIEVVLVDRERLLTLPFHVLNQTPKPSLDLLLAVSIGPQRQQQLLLPAPPGD
jgi:hypothetical protein